MHLNNRYVYDGSELDLQDLFSSLEYLRMIDPSTPLKEKIRKDLLAYCERDSLAMVKTRDELLKRCG